MKSTAFLLIFTLLSIIGFGQWQSNFGIGVENPQYKLDVDGDVNISSGHNFLIDGSPIGIGGNLWQTNENDIFFNKGNIGIGTDVPNEKLTIEGNTSYDTGRTFLKLKNNSTDSHSAVILKLFAGDNDSFTGLYHHSDTYTASDNYREVGVLWNHGKGLALRASGEGGQIRFETNIDMVTLERMRIDNEGNIGINTSEPREKLEVNGNILIKNNNALILTSPNGTEFKITVDDNGNLTTSEVTSIVSFTNELEVEIFPNPTFDRLTVKINDNSYLNFDAEIYNIAGKMVLMKNYSSNSFDINTSDFTDGSYILKIKTDNGELIKTEKFIKR